MPDIPFSEFFFGPGFWVSVGADFLLVVSIFFTLFYAAALLLASFRPAGRKLKPNGWGIPALLVLAALFTLSPAGEYLIGEARAALSLLELQLVDPAGGNGFKPWLILVWLIGAALALIWLGCRRISLCRVLAKLRRLEPDPALQRAARAAGCRKPVALLEAGPSGPVASWGLFRPLVMVPSTFGETYSERERFYIYLHELVHIRSRDSWKNLGAGLARALFWFNPGVLHAINRYANHLEIACDRKVMRLGQVAPDEYASLIARGLRTRHGLLTEFSGDCADVLRRLRYIYEDGGLLSPLRERLWTAACVVLLALCFAGSSGSEAKLRALVPDPDEATMAEMALLRQRAEENVIFRWGGLLGMYSASTWTPLPEPGAEQDK